MVRYNTTRSDRLLLFFCILSISSIQKREDKISNWWSSDPLLSNDVMKEITTGKKLHSILRLLHVPSLQEQPNRNYEDCTMYYQSFKVEEF